MTLSIINRYVIREILKYFSMILVMVISIYLIVDFLEKVDDFMEVGLPMTRMVLFFLYEIPFVISLVTPAALLLTVLVVFGLMNRNHEIIALRSSGISVLRLFRPVLFCGFVFSIGLFVVSELIVPATMGKANRIWNQEVRHEQAVSTREKNIWVRAGRTFAHFTYYDRTEKAVHGATISVFNDRFELVRRYDAARGRFVDGRWILEDVLVQEKVPGSNRFRVDHYVRHPVALAIGPDNLSRVVKKSEEMGFHELYQYVHQIESEGYDATAYRVDLHAKVAFPLVSVILCVVGVGISIRGRLREGLPTSIVYGLGVAFLYYVFYSFCISLGYGELLPPFLAAWAANIVFISVGSVILINADS